MSALNKSLPKRPAEQALIVTIGVTHANTDSDVRAALQALERAGFLAGPTSDEAIEAIYRQKRLVDGLARNDPGKLSEPAGYVVVTERDGETPCHECGADLGSHRLVQFDTEASAGRWRDKYTLGAAIEPVYNPKGTW